MNNSELQQAWHRLHVVTLRGGDDHSAYVEDYEAAKAAVVAALAQERPQWQPIETAPKDGTLFVAWNGLRRVLKYWDLGLSCWIYQPLVFEKSRRGDEYSDTHWMPLPSPPVGSHGTQVLSDSEPVGTERSAMNNSQFDPQSHQEG